MHQVHLYKPDGGPPAPLRAELRASEHCPVSSPSCPGSLPGPGEQPPQT